MRESIVPIAATVITAQGDRGTATAPKRGASVTVKVPPPRVGMGEKAERRLRITRMTVVVSSWLPELAHGASC